MRFAIRIRCLRVEKLQPPELSYSFPPTQNNASTAIAGVCQSVSTETRVSNLRSVPRFSYLERFSLRAPRSLSCRVLLQHASISNTPPTIQSMLPSLDVGQRKGGQLIAEGRKATVPSIRDLSGRSQKRSKHRGGQSLPTRNTGHLADPGKQSWGTYRGGRSQHQSASGLCFRPADQTRYTTGAVPSRPCRPLVGRRRLPPLPNRKTSDR